jgi:hypothetical protein
MLSRQKEQFSEVFYIRHRQHAMRALRTLAIFLTISGATAGISLAAIFRGGGDAPFTSLATAVFLFLALATCLSVPNLFRVRVLPYFERRLGGTDTWLAGESLLWHSRHLDATAAQLSVRPLSEFASGDDLIRGEELRWFSAEDGLRTVERLMQPDAAASFSADVVSDLSRLRDALRLACSQGVRFCLLLREGSGTSGYEMGQRRGSFV